MPEISRFYGIVIRVEGRFPKRALALVLEWTEKNRAALQENWTKLERREPLDKVPPLE